MYIHENQGWPKLTWNTAKLADLLAEVRHLQGRLLGQMEGLGFQDREEASLQALTQDVIKTSAIEGENLDAHQVRSSLARRLGIVIAGALPPVNRNVEGIVEVLLDATRHYQAPLTAERLFGWHGALFPTGRSGLLPITVGKWRTDISGPMQVISGHYGREKIHFEAPSHDRLQYEMVQFMHWVNTASEEDPVIKAAMAHFWFVTIHPFDDGNGRIARAITDLLVARAEHSTQRFYSMSSQIQSERKDYYHVLERTQKGELDISSWIEWFLNCLKRAILASEDILTLVLIKTRFWQTHSTEPFNERQREIMNRLFDGFEGKLNSSKWAKIGKCSQDTALRDINDLVTRGILIKTDAGGRSTGYALAEVCLQKRQ